jgi:hypothetical protein
MPAIMSALSLRPYEKPLPYAVLLAPSAEGGGSFSWIAERSVTLSNCSRHSLAAVFTTERSP